MSDNPTKKKLDGKRVSQQPWEQAYQRRKNARKKKETVAPLQVSRKDANNHAGKKQLIRLSYKGSEIPRAGRNMSIYKTKAWRGIEV